MNQREKKIVQGKRIISPQFPLLVSALLLLILIPLAYSYARSQGEEKGAQAPSPPSTRSTQSIYSYPDPFTSPWFTDAQLSSVTTPDYQGYSYTYDYGEAFNSSQTLGVGWIFLENINGSDGFNYTFDSTSGLDFDNDLTFGEKIQVIGGILQLWKEDDPSAAQTEPKTYHPLWQLLWEINDYYFANGSLPQSVIDLNPKLGDTTTLQAMWDTLQITDYGALNVFLWDVGQYFHQGCGTLMQFDFNGSLDRCGMTLHIVQDPELRRYAVLHMTGVDPGPDGDTSAWFILYYRLYGSTPEKVIREEVFASPSSSANLLSGGGNSAQGATGGGPPVQGLPLPGKGGVSQLTK